jgi:hypothetical protein
VHLEGKFTEINSFYLVPEVPDIGELMLASYPLDGKLTISYDNPWFVSILSCYCLLPIILGGWAKNMTEYVVAGTLTTKRCINKLTYY